MDTSSCPICAEIPSESLLQVPARSTPTMPSRFPPLSGRSLSACTQRQRTGHLRTLEVPQGILLEQSMMQMGCPQRSRSLGGGVGVAHSSTMNLANSNRMRPMRPIWVPPIPPQGDGACGWSQDGSSSTGSSPRSNPNSTNAMRLLEMSSHEEVPNEEPLAQLPVHVWLRAAGSSRTTQSDETEETDDIDEPTVTRAHMIENLPPLELSSSWQVADELGHTGGMAAPRYLLVRLGECIPAETGAAPVHLSRLDTGPQWCDFLNYGEGRDPRSCLALDELLACPCCLSIYRQPVALPCGHSLCRACFARISSQASHLRRCPLCRTEFPQCDIRVNLALAAVCDSLRAFRAFGRPRTGHLFFG